MKKKELTFEVTSAKCRLCGDLEHQEPLGQEHYIGTGQRLTICNSCSLVYLHPDMTNDSLDYFYNELYRKTYTFEASNTYDTKFFEHSAFKEIAIERLKTIEKYIDLSKLHDFFELGSGFGANLTLLSKTYPELTLSACEIDVTNRTRLCREAHVKFQKDLNSLDNTSIDLAFAFHVFEHLKDPLQSAEIIFSKMRQGGFLVIEVPDVESNWGKWNHHIHAAHVTYFSKASLIKLFERAGFEVLYALQQKNTIYLNDTLLVIGKKVENQTCNPLPPNPEKLKAHIRQYKVKKADLLKLKLKRLAIKILGPNRIGQYQRRKFFRSIKNTNHDY